MAKTSSHESAASAINAAVNNQRAVATTTQATNTPATNTQTKSAPTNTPAAPKSVSNTQTNKTPVNAPATPKPATGLSVANTPEKQTSLTNKQTQQPESIVVNEQEADNTQNEQESSNDTPAQVSSGIRTNLSDTDFLALNKEEQEKYLAGLGENKVEKDHLLGLLKEKEKKKELSDEDLTGKLKRTHTDPDSARKSNQEVKAEKGDIIEWMMEKIIMRGLEKAGDFVVDQFIYVTYGAAHIVFKGGQKITEPVSEWFERKNAAFKKWIDSWGNKAEKPSSQEQSQEQSQNPSQPEPTNEPPSTPNSGEEKEPTFKNVIYDLEKAKTIDSPDPKQIDAMLLLGEDLLKHNIVLEDDGYIKAGAKHPYPDCGKKYSNKDIKEFLETYRLTSDARASVLFLNAIDPNGNNPELREAAEKWMINKNKLGEYGAKTGVTKSVDLSDTLKKHRFTEEILNQHLNNARNEVLLFDRTQPHIDRINNNANLFACNYAQYKLLEMARVPDSEDDINKLQNPKDLKNLRRLFEAEGKNIMLRNYEALRQGSDTAISEEQMLQLSEKMSQTSQNLYKNRDTKTSSPNLVEEWSLMQKENLEPKDLNSYADSLSANDTIGIYRNNLQILNQEEAFLQSRQQENNSTRESIEAMKKRIKSADIKNQSNQLDNLQKYAEKNKVGNIQFGSFNKKEKE